MQHLQIIRIIDWICGITGAISGLGLVAAGILGASLLGMLGITMPEDKAAAGIIAIVFGTVGLIGGGFILILSVLSIIAGNALVEGKPWSRIYHIIIGALSLPGFPVGTAIGVYYLWALLACDEAKAVFEGGGS
ncbi:MAG: hypothetical protein RDV48_25420 [Candidatus Eremiobacteraeota bacterium]|nr:hypothetical protein [Candidatus Eremiobacteraeota bacterium]